MAASMSREMIEETTKKRLEELIAIYMDQTQPQAFYWAGLLSSMPGFSFYYFRTHLLLGDRNLFFTAERKRNPNLQPPVPCSWYVLEGRQTGRMEDVLDRPVYLMDGRVTAPIIGIDTKLNRILAEDGQVYELHTRVTPVVEPQKAALLCRN
jgi:hypothetical protein